MTVATGLRDILDAVSSPASLSISRLAATALLSCLWQSALLTGFLWVALKMTPRTSAALRFVIWASAFAVITGLPLLPLALDSAIPNVAAAATLSALSHKPWFALDIRWGIALAAVWAFASIWRAADLVLNSIRLRKLWKTARPVGDDLRGSSPLVSGRRLVLCTTTELERPAVIGFFSPRILVPEWLFARLSSEELDQIVLHETEHLRRRDDWTNLFQKLALVVFPLNPALVWIDRKLCLEREMACDDGVVNRTKAPRAYATCLANLAERSLERKSKRSFPAEALSLGAWQRRPELASRIHSVLKNKPTLGKAATTSLIGVFASGLVFGSAELAHSPQLVSFVEVAPSSQNASLELPDRVLEQPRGGGRETLTAFRSKANDEVFRPVLASVRVPVRSSLVSAHKADPTVRHSWARPENKAGRLVTSPGGLRAADVPAAWPANLPADGSQPLDGRPVLAKATSGEDATELEQGWMVVTTWEQMSEPAEAATATKSEEPGYQTVISRMVVKIVPANFVTTSPNGQAIRTGWLVFQL